MPQTTHAEPKTPRSESWTQAQALLADATPDSDEAVILTEALARADGLDADAEQAMFASAMDRAEAARTFAITEESPLPEGWPAPSLPGLIRVKTYPPTREAWVEQSAGANGQFMTLFRHIKSEEIAMTAPVVMQHEDAMPTRSPEAMAFLYRHTEQGESGEFGPVEVRDTEPMLVVSVGLMGPYRTGPQREALADLYEWLDAHPEYTQAGPPRVLGYNSPFQAARKKYSEVQLPIAPVE